MQVQIKRQLKIELDQADITEAVRAYLAGNGYAISTEDLAKINFVKSPKDGLRAELNITEETGIDEPEVIQVNEPSIETHAEGPGEIATPTVEDVAPNVAAAVDLVLPETSAGAEESEPETPVEPVADAAVETEAEAPRTKLFV